MAEWEKKSYIEKRRVGKPCLPDDEEWPEVSGAGFATESHPHASTIGNVTVILSLHHADDMGLLLLT